MCGARPARRRCRTRPSSRGSRGPAWCEVPEAAAARAGDAAADGVPDRLRRGDARRQRAVQPRHLRHHLDGRGGRPPLRRDVRQEHDRQGRVPADRRDRGALRADARRPVARAATPPTASAPRRPAAPRAACSAGLALKRRWQQARRAAGKPTERPNIVMGGNVQVVWEKFANYWEVEPRYVPLEGDVFHLTADRLLDHVDENTIGVVAVLGSTMDGSYEPVAGDLRRAGRATRPTAASRSRCTSTRPPAASSRRSSSRTWSGTSGSSGWCRSRRRGTSSASSTRAWAGCCGATPSTCRRTWSSTSTTSAATCRRSP